MKKLLLILSFLLIFCGAAHAETAMDYALWLEEALPDAAFKDEAVPEFVTHALGADYEFIARSDEAYGSYIAGVRRESAPALPEDVHQSSYSGTFETRVFRAEDNAGNIYYDFVLADGIYMHAYDSLAHLIIWIDPDAGSHSEFQKMFTGASSLIFNAADPQYRARLRYAANHGFSPEDTSRCQMLFPVHNLESWQAGATDQPYAFYLNMTPPADVLGNSYMEEEELIQYTRIPIGLSLKEDGQSYELVLSEDGTLGVETEEPHRLYEAGPGCEALLDLAEKVLGYRPGNCDFLGKSSLRATLQWQERKWLEYDESNGREVQMGWDAGCVAIDDAESLRRLDDILNHADFTVGSVNCPSNLFLSIEYSDGTCADFAVAINSYNLFFRNGMYFTAGDGEIIDLFNFRETTFWKGSMENEPYVQG